MVKTVNLVVYIFYNFKNMCTSQRATKAAKNYKANMWEKKETQRVGLIST